MENENDNRCELCYIWFCEKPLIKEQGFNFSSKYEFKLNKCINDENINIEVIENKNYIENFFGENIMNISAVIGKNGAGKSTLMRIINSVMPDLFSNDNIIIFNKNNAFYIFTDRKISLHMKKKVKVKIYTYNDFYKQEDTKKIFRECLKISFISYSNDIANELSPQSGNTYPTSINISTNLIIKELSRYYKKIGERENDVLDKYYQHGILLMLFLLRKRRKEINEIIKPEIKYISIEAINNYEDDKLRNDRLLTINTMFNGNEKKLLLDNKEIKKIRKFQKDRGNLLDGLLERVKNKLNIDYVKTITVLNILYEFYSYLSDVLCSYDDEKKDYMFNFYQNCNLQISLEDHAENVFNSFFKNVEKYINDLESNEIGEAILEKIKKYRELMETFLKLYEKNISISYNYIQIKLEDLQLEKLIEFLNKYWIISSRTYYIFKWMGNENERSLSSGEEAIFSMFSRLYYLIDKKFKTDILKKLDNEKGNLIIVMDEPEVHLHPEWQRKLISYLINFFKVIFCDYNIQLIISSNTPFLISDLPRENVILLEKDGNEQMIQNKEEMKGGTFAQNIHSLLADYFIRSTIGEFAEEKIKGIIDDINNGNIYQKKDILFKNINMIGEPLIRNKLLEMLRSKLNEL